MDKYTRHMVDVNDMCCNKKGSLKDKIIKYFVVIFIILSLVLIVVVILAQIHTHSKALFERVVFNNAKLFAFWDKVLGG